MCPLVHLNKGANQAVAVARLQHPVEMIGMVGNDRIGEELLENLKREGVGVSHVGIVAGSSGTPTISQSVIECELCVDAPAQFANLAFSA